MLPAILDDIVFAISAAAVAAAFMFSRAGAAPLLPSQQRTIPPAASDITDQAAPAPSAPVNQESAIPADVPATSALPGMPNPRPGDEFREEREDDD